MKVFYVFYTDWISHKIFQNLQPDEFNKCYDYCMKNNNNVCNIYSSDDSTDPEYIAMSNYI